MPPGDLAAGTVTGPDGPACTHRSRPVPTSDDGVPRRRGRRTAQPPRRGGDDRRRRRPASPPRPAPAQPRPSRCARRPRGGRRRRDDERGRRSRRRRAHPGPRQPGNAGARDGAPRPAPPTVIAPAAPNAWVAVLRTVGFGVDGEPGSSRGDPRRSASAVSRLRRLADVPSWLEGGVGALPATFDSTGDLPRAISRRLLSGGWGLREVATSLDGAFGSAEDLVYIESPAIDMLSIGADDDTISPVQTLVDRLDARPGLHVVLCLPRRSPPGLAGQSSAGSATPSPATTRRVRGGGSGPCRRCSTRRAGATGRSTWCRPPLWSTTSTPSPARATCGGAGCRSTAGWRRPCSTSDSPPGRPTAVRAFRHGAASPSDSAPLPPTCPLDPAELVGAVCDLAPRTAPASALTTGPISVPEPVHHDRHRHLEPRRLGHRRLRPVQLARPTPAPRASSSTSSPDPFSLSEC